MLKTRTTAILLLFSILSVPALAARKGRLIGKVTSEGKQPVEGVTVTITSPEIATFREVRTTDKKGSFTVDFGEINVAYVFKFEKTGHQPLEARLHWSKDGTEFYDWILPASEIVVETATAAPPASKSQPAITAYNSAILALRAKDHATAAAKLKEAAAHDPNLRHAWATLSSVELERKNYAEAVVAAEKAISLGSTEEAVYLARWRAYQAQKNDAMATEALKDLERIGRRAEEAKRVHNEAVALTRAGDHAAAFAKFQEALKVDPNLQVSLIGLANAGVKTGKHSEAIEAAETILKDDPNNEAAARVRFNAALALGEKKRLYDALVGLAPYEAKVARDGILKLAFEAYDANELDAAKQRFEKALEIDPSYPQAYYFLAVINAGRGANAEARQQIERFLKLAPNDPEAPAARDMLKYLK